MTNDTKIQYIKEWQFAGFVHPLTCGNDSGHRDLIGVIVNDEVILACEDCDYRQTNIPAVVFSDYVARMRKAFP